MSGLSGLILAGGNSTRMGEDKASLELGGKSLLEHGRALLTNSGCDEILISSNTLTNGLKDRFNGYGPVAGIEAALYHLLEQGISGTLIVIPIDMLLLRPQTISLLIDNQNTTQISCFEGQPLPMAIPIERYIQEYLEERLKNTTKERGIAIWALCDYVQYSTIALPDERQSEFFNCNTQDDFEQLRRLTKST